MRQALILAVSLAMCAPCAAQEASVETLLAQLEAPIQEQIDKIYDALNRPGVQPHSDVEVFKEVQGLKDSIADKFEIVKQLAIFAATPTPMDDERQLMTANVILHSLQLPPAIVIRVLAPYINADNSNLRSFVRGWFRAHDKAGTGVSPLEPVNYDDYLQYVRTRLNMNQEVPTAFVEYLYERSPERALLVFYHANPQRHAAAVARLREMREELEADRQQLDEEGASETPQQRTADRKEEIRQKVESELRREVLLAEHIVGNAIWLKEHKFGEEFQKALPETKVQLWKLSERDEWWARLYVAEIMRRHRELRQLLVIQRLSTDDNALVSKKARSVKK